MVRLSFEDWQKSVQETSLALGVFDGVHRGHQAVIAEACRVAKERGAKLGVLTFDPHPIQVLAPERAPKRLLANLEHKEELLSELGVDCLVVVKFDQEFAKQEAEDFTAALSANVGLCGLAMGVDWKFGNHRRGDVEFLENYFRDKGVEVSPVEAVMHDGERISSTRIRQALRDGNLTAAEQMLGRPYSVFGQVVEGQKMGRKLGFPTANLLPFEEQLPPNGVWKVRVQWGEESKIGIANLGVRPTVEDEGRRMLEVHLPDWSGDLYGKWLEVSFLDFVREERKFANLDALKKQIEQDLKALSI